MIRKELSGISINIRLSRPGVVSSCDRRPRWIVHYSFFVINDDTVPLAPSEAMQFGHTLDGLSWQIFFADSDFGPVFII